MAGEDVLLVLSNLIYALPAWEYFSRYHYTRAIIMFLLIFVSGTYHLCDSSLNACALPVQVHHNLDFFFSQLLVPLTALYFIVWPARWRYVERFLIVIIAVTIFLLQALVDTTQTLVQLLILLPSLLLILGAVAWNYRVYNWGYILGGLLVTLASFVFFYFGPECYWLMHSLWHVLSGVAQFLFARLKNREKDGQYLALDARAVVRISKFHGLV